MDFWKRIGVALVILLPFWVVHRDVAYYAEVPDSTTRWLWLLGFLGGSLGQAIAEQLYPTKRVPK